MSILSKPVRAPETSAAERSDLGVPRWATELLQQPDGQEAAAFSLVTVRKAGAASLDPKAFEACTRDAYTSIATQLRDRVARYPVRFWNYIPDIHRPCGE